MLVAVVNGIAGTFEGDSSVSGFARETILWYFQTMDDNAAPPDDALLRAAIQLLEGREGCISLDLPTKMTVLSRVAECFASRR